MPSIDTLLRPDIAALEAYTPVAPIEVLARQLGLPVEQILKLDANESPYGPSPRAAAAIDALGGGQPSPEALQFLEPLALAIYPDPTHAFLREQLSVYTGQPASRILCSSGSGELIDLLMRAFIQPGDVIIDCPPTFGMYSFDGGLHAAQIVNVERDADFNLDAEAVAKLADLVRLEAVGGMERFEENLLRRLRGDLLDVHAPLVRNHQHRQAAGAVDDDAEVEFAVDVAARLDEDLLHQLSFGTSLDRDQFLAQQGGGDALGVLAGLHEFDAALRLVPLDRPLAAAAGMDLGLHHGELPAELVEGGGGFVGGLGGDAGRYADPRLAEEGFALEFVNFHGESRKNRPAAAVAHRRM